VEGQFVARVFVLPAKRTCIIFMYVNSHSYQTVYKSTHLQIAISGKNKCQPSVLNIEFLGERERESLFSNIKIQYFTPNWLFHRIFRFACKACLYMYRRVIYIHTCIWFVSLLLEEKEGRGRYNLIFITCFSSTWT
jgi:hypothetical protein